MKVERIVIAVLALALAFNLGGQMSRAQVSGPESANPAAAESRPAAAAMSDAIAAAAAMSDAIPIQGRLTDAGGQPLNGSYSLTARIYDVSTGGTARCSDNKTVTVTSGLFSMDVNHCTPANINGDQLYLGIQVGSDPEMTPRQPLNGVPYAWTLRPGSIVKGADSYVFVPGSAVTRSITTDTLTWWVTGTHAYITSGNAAGGWKHIVIPITIPAVLYGQPTRITSMTVYYYTSNPSNAYIVGTELFKEIFVGTSYAIIINSTVRNSGSPSSYTLTASGPDNTLSSDYGALSAGLDVQYGDNGSYIMLSGVRIQLTHSY